MDRVPWATDGLEVVVRDEHGTPLQLVRWLGGGRQGDVWVTSGERVAVKILKASGQAAGDDLARRLRTVRRLDLSGLALSRPLAMLARPHIGYTMEMLADMAMLRTLLAPPPRKDLVEWYTATGGLRRRLRLLGRAAGILAALHARGMAFGDPSPSNLLISVHVDREEVWLIDVDNVAVTSEVRDAFATRGYTAPELGAGRMGVSSLTDAYAFAVMAFQTLVGVHPFVGDAVDQGEAELLDAALAAELPWIDHSAEAGNRTRLGHRRSTVLTPGLQALAKSTFETALLNPLGRPLVAEWRTKLMEAAGMTLRCENCTGSFYVSAGVCPWCGEPAPPALLARVLTHVPGSDPAGDQVAPAQLALAVQRGVPTDIPLRVATLDHEDPERPVASLRLGIDDLNVRNLWTRPAWLVAPGGHPLFVVEPGQQERLPGSEGGRMWELHFGPRAEHHRLLSFAVIRREDGR
jgi:DNA-binding helix-hairpin-helix protein with protein kinase domain